MVTFIAPSFLLLSANIHDLLHALERPCASPSGSGAVSAMMRNTAHPMSITLKVCCFLFLTKFVFSDRFLIHLRLLELSRRNYVLGKLTQGGCG